MNVTDFCKSYFNGFQDASNYKKNDTKTNALAALKILSYFTVIIPLGVAVIYGTASLCGRVSKKESLSSQDKSVDNQAKKTLISDTSKVHSPNDSSELPKVELSKESLPSQDKSVDNQEKKTLISDTSKIHSPNDSSELPKVELSQVLDTYLSTYKPRRNEQNLLDYSRSEDYKRHAKTARIYYNSNQLAESDALKVIFQREPTNIGMGANQYNEEKLEKLFGYKKGVYNDLGVKKTDGSSFKELPNSATVYSETYLWTPAGGSKQKEIACLSLPAPALDSVMQPHYKYYVQEGKLDEEKYDKEMAGLTHEDFTL